MKAKISEIFSSIQGEGLYLGKRQIFVRFYGCNMKCAYCDTMSSRYEELSIDEVTNEIAKFIPRLLHFVRNDRRGTSLAMTTRGVTRSDKYIRSLREAKRRGNLIYKPTVSLTGGEPLVHVAYLKLLLKKLRALGVKTYLETNGTLPAALNKVIEMVDIIAMDIKLPSSTYDKSFWDEHEKFLKIAKGREVFIKIIVTGNTKKDEFEQAVRLIKNVAQTIPLIIQPVTPCGIVQKASNAKLNNFYNHASFVLKDVRIIPQVHKIMGWL